MEIKRLNEMSYEIQTKEDLIYISKEKNPGTKEAIGKELYLYFIDVFELQWCWELKVSREPYESENFNEYSELIEYLENNFNIPKSIIKKINFSQKVENQYEIRELIILNFIEWFASEEKDREPLRQSMQLYLQQEIWVELEGMELKQVGEIEK